MLRTPFASALKRIKEWWDSRGLKLLRGRMAWESHPPAPVCIYVFLPVSVSGTWLQLGLAVALGLGTVAVATAYSW